MGFWTALRRTAPAVAAAAVLGSIGTRPGSRWYRGLRKPGWQPPAAAFGPVWTVLYVLIAVGTARAMSRSEGVQRARIERVLWLNLGLNAGWSWLFFTARRPDLALAEIGLLDASEIELIWRSGRADPVAGIALAPYLAWSLFATALNGAVWKQNTQP